MTVAGETALSVEISTNAPTPSWPGDRRDDARADRVVADRLDGVAAPSGRRACRRRRGRRPPGAPRRAPRASAPPPCSRRAPARSPTGGRGAPPRARAGSRNRLSSAWSTRTSRRGATRGDLAAQLGADRAAGAGDHHDLRPRGSARRGRAPCGPARGRARPRRWTSRTWRARLTDPVRAARRRSAACARGMPRSRQARTTSHAQRARRRGDRDDDLVGLGLVEDLRQLARRPAHAHAVDAQPLLARVVVDEADRVQPELRVARDLRQTRRPPSPAPTISTSRAPWRARKPGSRRSLIARASTARGGQERPA